MTIPRETVTAYVDGELSSEDARRIEAQMANDPELAAAVERERALRRTLRNAFAPVMDAPVPAQLYERIAADARRPSAWMRWRGRLNDARARLASPWSWVPAGSALAAGLVAGLLSGTPAGNSDVPIAVRAGGALVATGTLDEALTGALAAETANAASGPRIGVTFRTKDGQICRTFEMQGGEHALAGFACREGAGWNVAVLAAATPQPAGEYRPAGAALPPAIRGEVERLMAGEPFDAEAERAARAAGWTAR